MDCEDRGAEEVVVPEGVVGIGRGAFAGCTQLAKATFAEGLETVGDGAFENCWRMMSVSLPASVTAVSLPTFADCDSLSGVTVPSGVAPLSEWFAPVYRQIKDVTVPSGEVNVCPNMFKDCTALESAVLPDGVTNVSEDAFWNCTKLPLVGSADSALLVHVTDAATYNAYREWALKIGATDVKASPFAWASFATDSAALLEKIPTDEDLTIEEFKPTAAAGAFEFTVSVKDVAIGFDAAAVPAIWRNSPLISEGSV